MKKKLRKIIVLFFIISSLSAVVLLTSFNSEKQKSIACEGIEVEIDTSTQVFFLDGSDVKDLLVKALKDSMKGDEISSIDLLKVENILEKNPYINDAESYLDIQGNLHVHIFQNQPIARIINKYGVNYYITEKAEKFPVNNKFTCRVPVISGNIEEGLENGNKISSANLKNAFKVVEFMRANELWNAQIEQIYVNDENELEFIPLLGNHNVVLGDASDLEMKFHNLELFYKEGLSYVGWEKYKTVNVSILNQIYCTKKDNY